MANSFIIAINDVIWKYIRLNNLKSKFVGKRDFGTN